MARFILEDYIIRYSIFGRLIIDGGLENKGLVISLAAFIKFKRVQISAYNALANGIIKVGHKLIIKALLIVTDSGRLL